MSWENKPIWTPEYVVDETLNNSVKFFVSPPYKLWIPTNIRAHYITNATVGNRLLQLEITDLEGSTVLKKDVGATQGPSEDRSYYFALNMNDTTSFVNDILYCSLPYIELPPGYTFIIKDVNNIDPTGTNENLLVRGFMRQRAWVY